MTSITRIKGFDGLRAVAVTLVFVSHMRSVDAAIGSIAVYLFFVLSGYLITGILTGQRQTIEDGRSAPLVEISIFYARRCLRIFPAYYISLAAYLIWIEASSQLLSPSIPSLVFYYTNLSIIGENSCSIYLCHYWSLAIEEQFYLFAAPLLLLAARRLHLSVLSFIAITGVCSLFFAAHVGLDAHQQYFVSTTNFTFLAAGGVICILQNGRKWARLSGLMATISVCIVFVFVLNGPVLRQWSEPLYQLLFILTILSLAAIVGWVRENQQSSIVQTLEWGPISSLGTVSYGFYLIHPGVIHAYRGLVSWSGPFLCVPKPAQALLNALACFLVTYAVSQLSWITIERYFLNLKDQISSLIKHRAAGLGSDDLTNKMISDSAVRSLHEPRS